VPLHRLLSDSAPGAAGQQPRIEAVDSLDGESWFTLWSDRAMGLYRKSTRILQVRNGGAVCSRPLAGDRLNACPTLLGDGRAVNTA
jgi:hypothetical protein